MPVGPVLINVLHAKPGTLDTFYCSLTISHVKFSVNIVADSLPRTDVEAATKAGDSHSISKTLNTDCELQEFPKRPICLQLKDIAYNFRFDNTPKILLTPGFRTSSELLTPRKTGHSKTCQQLFFWPSCCKDISN
ncbi:hypothetical protein ACTXT7_016281 [Hymenolepis weldensis]